MGLRNWVSSLSGWTNRAMTAAMANGMTNEVIRDAYWLAQEAAKKFDESPQMRAFVIAQLVARGVPESMARMALEAAVQILRAERK
jgi:hypothetical protein